MRFIFPLFFIFILGCNANNIPGDILSKEKMEKVLWEMLEADELAYHHHPVDSIARKTAALQYYATIYQLNKLDPVTFKRSYDYYCDRPEMLSPVLDSARNRIPAPPIVPSDSKPGKIFQSE